METRKVQVTGGSTFTVSIPKDWAQSNGVSEGSIVGFRRDGDALWMTPAGGPETSECRVDARTADEPELHRLLTTMYVAGFDRVVVETGGRSTVERAIGVVAARLVGMEVVEQTADTVTLGNLLDATDVSTADTVERMRALATTMLEDAVNAVLEGDDELARGVVGRDDDVDRFWLVVSRLFRSALRAPDEEGPADLARETHYDYYQAARQFERVADHAQKVAHHAPAVSELPEGLAATLTDLHELVARVLREATEALFLDDSEAATARATTARAAVDGATALEREVDGATSDLPPEAARSLRLVVDSLSRCADYGGNVAETAIQHAAPRP